MDSSCFSEHYIHGAAGIPVHTVAVCERMRRYVNFARALFDRGACSFGRTMNFTFVARKSKLIAVGINDYRKTVKYIPMLRQNYRITKGEPFYKPSMHSELAAVLKMGLTDCSDLDFYNIRLDRSRQCRNSCFCVNCKHLLDTVGYKHLYYYDKNLNVRMMA